MVIDTVYDGIGDAVIYAWLAHSAKAAGLECRINMRRHVEMGYIFGVTPDMTTFEPGERFFIDRGNGSSQTADEVANVDEIGTRFRCWARPCPSALVVAAAAGYTAPVFQMQTHKLCD
jgi:hypothetical protein